MAMNVILLVLAIQSAGTGSLSGEILDPSGAVIPRASVALRRPASEQSWHQRTDATGRYSFEGMEAGRYYVTADASGFSTVLKKVTVGPGGALVEDFSLNVAALAEQLSVTASRTDLATGDTPVAMSVVDSLEIEQSNVSTLGDVFRNIPGASVVSEGPFRVRPKIRGLDSNRVLVLVDGERLNNTRTSTANSGIEVGLVDISTVERVEVARGSGSVLYGTDALGGTINIITQRTPAQIDSGVRVSGGLRGLLSSNETGRQGAVNLGLSTRWAALRFSQSLDRFSDYRSGQTGEAPADSEVINSAYHGSSSRAEARFYFAGNQSVHVGYDRRRAADVGVPGASGIFTAWFPFSNREKVRLGWQAENPTPTLAQIKVSGYYQLQERNFSNQLTVPASPPAFPGSSRFSETVTNTETVGFDIQTNWIPAPTDVLTMGFSFFRDLNRDTRFIERFDPNFRTFPPSLVRSEDHSRSVPNATFSNLAVFAQNDLELTPRLRVTAGLRGDFFDIESKPTAGFDLPVGLGPDATEDLNVSGLEDGVRVDDISLSGDVGIVVHASEALSLTARVGRSFREPNLFERFFTDFGSVGGFVVGNPDLEPETGVNIDVGTRLDTGRFRMATTVFYNRYRNFLTLRSATDRDGNAIMLPGGIALSQTLNADRVRTWGVEVEFESPVAIPRSILTPFGNLSYLRGDDLARNEPLSFITPLKVVLGLRWQDDRNRLWNEYGTRIVTSQGRLSDAFLAANEGPEPGYVVHDWRIGMNIPREDYRIGITVGLLNLGNRLYSEQFVSVPARGRSVTLGLNMDF